jgi:hypothetical protein
VLESVLSSGPNVAALQESRPISFDATSRVGRPFAGRGCSTNDERSRGSIAPGMKVDLCLFDPERINDRATFADPTQLPDGIAWVFVNGIPVLHDRNPSGRLPGSLLRMDNAIATRA